MARISESTTRLLVPLGTELSFALIESVRFHLRLYRVSRAAASFSLRTMEQVVESLASRNGAKGIPARLILRASRSRLRLTLSLPAGRISFSRLKRLLRQPPPSSTAVVRAGRGGPILTLEVPIPGKS